MSATPRLAALGGLFLLATCSKTVSPPPDGTPRLIVFVVVDQMRADYLDRFELLFTGGLRRLLAEGVRFTDTHHRHVPTSTAPGHATLATGLHPRHHGIVGNYWFDRSGGSAVYSVGDPRHGRSPRLLEAATLGDRIKRVYPAARLFSIGGKDRSAILMGGKTADAAYWYDRANGNWVTSTYYRSRDPEWLERFHRDHHIGQEFGQVWEPIRDLAKLEPFDIAPLDQGVTARSFPHWLGDATGPASQDHFAIHPTVSYFGDVYESPFLDRYTLDMAEALIVGEELGLDDYPDLLTLALSGMDSVGHLYGPDSPELADTIERLDLRLGSFLTFLDEVIGLEHVMIVLSSDHGVGTVPELLSARGEAAARFGVHEISCFQKIGGRFTERFGDRPWLASGIYFDRDLIASEGADEAAMKEFLRESIEACPRVVRALDPEMLLAESASLDEVASLYLNGHHSERSPDLYVQLEPDTLTIDIVPASHGSPYAYDTHVPWLLRLPVPIVATIEQPTSTTDIAPTLAGLIGIPWTDPADGVDRSPLW